MPLWILFLVNALNIYDRQAISALVEPLRREFQLSDTQLGGLATLFTVVYALAGVPLGKLADTTSRKRLLAAGIALWAALTALGAAAGSYAMLLISRLGVGVGEAVCAPTATSWIGDLVPPNRRAKALAFFMLGVPVGIALSYAVTGAVAQAWGWRVALLVAAAPALLLIPAVLLLPEPTRPVTSAASGKLPIDAVFVWIVISGALVNACLYAFSTFLPAYLTRVHGYSVAQAGAWSGLGTLAAGLAGAGLAGWLGVNVQNRLSIAAVESLAAVPAMLLGIALLPLCLLAGYGLLQMYYGLVYSAIQDIMPAHLRGRAMAVYFLAMYLCGASFGPLLTGRLSDVLARSSGLPAEAARAAGLHGAMYVVPALALAVAISLWCGARAMERKTLPR